MSVPDTNSATAGKNPSGHAAGKSPSGQKGGGLLLPELNSSDVGDATAEVADEPSAPLLPPPTVADQPAMPMTSLTAEAVIWPVRVASEWAARLILIAIASYLFLRVLEKVSFVAFTLVIGLFFTAILHPVEAKLRERLSGRKSLSTAIVLLSGVALFGLIGWFVVAQISSHSGALAGQVSQAGQRIQRWLETGPFHVRSADTAKWITNVTDAVRSHQAQLASRVLSTAQVLAEFIGGLFLAILSAFFMLRDGDIIWRWMLRLIPTGARPRTDIAGNRGWHTLGGYIRGEVTIAVIHSLSIFIALLILRVPLAAPLAVVIFLGSFIPILGLTVAGTICVAVTFLEHGVTAAVVIAIVIIVLVQLEGHVLQPVIMSRAVHLHPLAVALAVASGTTLYGVVGALVAVPLVAFLNSFVRGLRDEPADPVAEGEKPGDTTSPPTRTARRPRTTR